VPSPSRIPLGQQQQQQQRAVTFNLPAFGAVCQSASRAAEEKQGIPHRQSPVFTHTLFFPALHKKMLSQQDGTNSGRLNPVDQQQVRRLATLLLLFSASVIIIHTGCKVFGHASA